MSQDALASARRIRQPVESPADVGSAFDAITYDKGAAVLAMLERFVGAKNFQHGIHEYLLAHQYGNADTSDLVDAIAATRPDLPKGQVTKAFFSFLDQPGTPLVQLDWSCSTQGSSRVTVRQSRYLPVGSEASGGEQWRLPLCVVVGAGHARQEHCQLIEGQQASFQLPTSCPDYVMPNADAAGYYRFGLSMPHWKILLAAPDLTAAEQLAAADSLSGAFHAGVITTGEYLALLPGLLRSDSVDVVTEPLDDMQWIHDRLLDAAGRKRLNEILADYYSDIAEHVPPDARPDDRDQVQLQTSMARLYALQLRAPVWREALSRQAVAYLKAGAAGRQTDDAVLPANLRAIAFTVAVEERGTPFAERLLDVFKGSADAQLREDILQGMSRGGNPQLLARLRELALTDAVRGNEVGDILWPQMEEAASRDAAWQWLLAHFDGVAAREPYWFRGNVVRYGSVFCSPRRAQQISSELTGRVKAMGSGTRSLAETVERIHLCHALVQVQQGPAQRVLVRGPGA